MSLKVAPCGQMNQHPPWGALHGLVGLRSRRYAKCRGWRDRLHGDDHPSRLTVCRQEQFQATLEIWSCEKPPAADERVVVLGGVKGLSLAAAFSRQGRRLGGPGHGGVVSASSRLICWLAISSGSSAAIGLDRSNLSKLQVTLASCSPSWSIPSIVSRRISPSSRV